MNVPPEVTLSFSPGSLRLLNFCLAFIMFGVAMNLRPSHLREVLRAPAGLLVGIFSQLAVLPGITLLLVLALGPPPGIALGMFLVAACPGGNVSNYFSLIGRGNPALSVSMTAVSTTCSVLATPFLFHLAGHIYGPTADLLQRIQVPISDVLVQVFLVLTLPVALGIIFAQAFPATTRRIADPVGKVSFLLLLLFIAAALYANGEVFFDQIRVVFGLVLAHNALALLSGYLVARAAGQPVRNRRSIAIETGIQNSGLGLILIFNFFGGAPEMALVAAWWGVWHIVAGATVAKLFAHLDALAPGAHPEGESL
jgi:BASS family bile acid:Na+ symporter